MVVQNPGGINEEKIAGKKNRQHCPLHKSALWTELTVLNLIGTLPTGRHFILALRTFCKTLLKFVIKLLFLFRGQNIVDFILIFQMR